MKKRLSVMFALLSIVFSSLVSLTPVQAQTVPESTTVNIHKVVWDAEPSYQPIQNIDALDISHFGGNARWLAGAQFEYWAISEADYNSYSANNDGTTTGPASGTGTALALTDGNGHTSVSLPQGYYWFKEIETPGIDQQISTSFGLVLPFANADGSGYVDNLHIYPKNVSTTSLEKTVGNLVNMDSPYDIGEEITYYLEARIPAGVINKFEFTDTLSAGLEFVPGSAQVHFSPLAVTDVAALPAGSAISDTPNGNTWTFDLAASHADGLAANRGGYAYVSYRVKITEEAVVATDLANSVNLVIGREGQPDVDASDEPVTTDVHTGGKQFIKENRSNGEGLAGAEFVIRNEAGDFYNYDAAANVVTWGAQDTATILTSGADGRFEIKGLAYGEEGSDAATGATTYYLVETQAPDGFVIPAALADGLAFTVNASSYNETETELTVELAEGTVVNNSQAPIIPNTGGIGAIIFIVAGVLIIGLALFMIKKRFAND
ncbi:SpaH/EbpB family LPXTG-anchored major pilin [Fundicoccus culcitae]|uniref:SpaH/EbpB family LPXTG-anchored major pilin n=1 Tax=Fundicoccus culcitae TaxID=2969821 RepID=A0ABY5P8M6_9LACT|nr:SpaH/EbpB family LPXTG-anchored major pilin [Fundicoccus culcitae]UUX35108.1 SpaH/EbpB family LPXTG-anchored major pilin [Fundicoccus culcitae]